jgi:AraC-like DNA-binding protein
LLVFYLFVCWLWHSRLAEEEVNENSDARVWIGLHEADSYVRQLIQGMESSRIYLKTGCTIADVAAVCQVSVRQLSYLLNHHLKLKFVDFISYYRLRHVVTIIGSQSHLPFTLEEMSRQCGFGSRSNFHRVVKLYTGQSPKTFLQPDNNAPPAFDASTQFDRLRVYLAE